MKLSELHLLLTYQCNFECDHCFVWGGPRQQGTMALADIRRILQQSEAMETVEWIYFEGGEPFLFYPILVSGVEMAVARGYQVGVVTNAYWATEKEDARTWLQPLAGLIQDLSVSGDLFHWDEMVSTHVRNTCEAAEDLNIPLSTISVAQPNETDATLADLMFRGRAADELAPGASHQPWDVFDACPYEDLKDPGRVHIDPLGNVHICQGISIGNLLQKPLVDICATYEPSTHPVVGPLLQGGPTELARHHGFRSAEAYADACHLCYDTRLALRQRFPDILGPDQMYGLCDG